MGAMTKPQPYSPVDARTDKDNERALSLTRPELRSLVLDRVRNRESRS